MTISANFPNVQPSLLLDFANAKQLPPSVTFTRATTATYYNGSTTAMAEQNLVRYSQEFDNAVWTPSNTSIVANNTTAPDGTSTADKVIIAANTSFHDAFANGFLRVANQQYTHSIYVKAGTGIPAVYLYTNRDAVGLIAKFDISAGTYIGNAGGDGYGAFDSYSITSVGNGWYRITATFTAASNSSSTFTLGISTTTANTVVPITGNGTDFCYIWGAQLEQRSSATAYTATTTQPITNYIPVLLTAGGGQPRFDHNPTTSESLGLLIEQQSTNLALYSSDFSNAVWSKIRSSVSSNVIIAPDGTLTGDKLVEDSTASNTHFILQNIALGGSVDSSPYAVSIYAKAGERTRLQMFDNNSVSSGVTVFDLSTGTVVSGTGKITSVGNGWYRCSIYPLKDYATNSTVWIILDNGTTTSYTGNGFSGLYIWGFQLETTSFITSYIPTTSASATRAEDGASMTGINLSSWFNNAQGTLYIDGIRFGTNLYPRFAGFYSGNTENYSMGIGQWSASTVSFYGVNGTTQFDISRAPSGLAYGSQVRAAGAYAVNNVGLSANGTATSVDTDATIPYIDTFWIGGGVNPRLNGWLKKVAYYPVRVTDAQLQALTT